MGCTNSKTPAITQQQQQQNGGETQEEQPKLKVVVAGKAPKASDTISNVLALGAGCYWGTEKYVYKDFQKKFPNSIQSTKVGFMSPLDRPKIPNPNYRQVCSGASGHVEVLYIELTSPQDHFEELCRFFFQFHDPTTKDRQGNDRGFQYSSWIFCSDEEQSQIATKVKQELQDVLNHDKNANAASIIKPGTFAGTTVHTQIKEGPPLKEFTPAEEEHQMYLFKNPNGYCNHRIRLKEWYTTTTTSAA